MWLNMQNKKIKVIFLIIIICLITATIINHNLIEKKLKDLIKKEELPKFEYNFYEKTSDDKYISLLKFRDLNGINEISYTEDNGKEVIIKCNGKKEVSIDFGAENYSHHYFKTISSTGETIINDLYLDIKTTYNAEILEYPIFTKNGMVNVKNINSTDSQDYYYSLDLTKNCTAIDALDKKAYDGDENTYFDPILDASKNKFIFGSDIDVYQCSFKVDPTGSGTIFYAVNNRGYILYSEGAIVNETWFHTTYYGKGTSAWVNWMAGLSTKVYEIKYDSNL